jgi:hypothetical protein
VTITERAQRIERGDILMTLRAESEIGPSIARSPASIGMVVPKIGFGLLDPLENSAVGRGCLAPAPEVDEESRCRDTLLESPDQANPWAATFSPDETPIVFTTNEKTPAAHLWDLRVVPPQLSEIGLALDLSTLLDRVPAPAPSRRTVVEFEPAAREPGATLTTAEHGASLSAKVLQHPNDPAPFFWYAPGRSSSSTTVWTRKATSLSLSLSIDLGADSQEVLIERARVWLRLRRDDAALTDFAAAGRRKPPAPEHPPATDSAP